MSNPTTPFSWQMPTNTDLVTDLPADFEVFGQAVATSMQYLLGGTTGQVLSKTSGTDMAFTWTTANPGDITGVTAGTGISGGGTSGTVTVTNDMATTITSNGDLIYGTGSGTYTRRAIGSTGNVLTVAGGIPTWAAPASGVTFNGARVYNTATQTFTNATAAAFAWNAESFDTNTYHDNTTNNSRLTVPTTGTYLISFVAIWASNVTGARIVELKKNGASIGYIETSSPGTANNTFSCPFSASAGEYFEIFGYQNSGGNLATAAGGAVFNYFSIVYLGA